MDREVAKLRRSVPVRCIATFITCAQIYMHVLDSQSSFGSSQLRSIDLAAVSHYYFMTFTVQTLLQCGHLGQVSPLLADRLGPQSEAYVPSPGTPLHEKKYTHHIARRGRT